MPLLSHATAAGSLAVVNILMGAGPRENAGATGNRPGECIGAALAGRANPTQEAAIARTLSRGPALNRGHGRRGRVPRVGRRRPRLVFEFFGRMAAGSSQHVLTGEDGTARVTRGKIVDSP